MANTFFPQRPDLKKASQQDSHEEKRFSTKKSLSFLSHHASSLTNAQKTSLQSQDDTQQLSRRAIVDVGGNGDCGFRAIAAGIMDNVLANKALFANKVLMTTLFEIYDRYAPANMSQPKDPYERLKNIFVAPMQRAQFIVNLAVVLRHMAVDEMLAHPEHYRGAFIRENEGTSPQMMRKPETWIDESAIAALSNTLNLPIQVNAVEQNKELPHKYVYHPASKQDNKTQPDRVVIQLASGHYQPLVKRPEAFQISGMNTMSISIDGSKIVHNDPPMEEILATIDAYDQMMVEKFENYHNELTSLCIDNKLDKSQLLSIYIEGMKGSDYLQGFSRYHDLHRAHFETVVNAARNGDTVNTPTETQEEYVVKCLIHAISRAMTIGHLDENVIFNVLEDKQSAPVFGA